MPFKSALPHTPIPTPTPSPSLLPHRNRYRKYVHKMMIKPSNNQKKIMKHFKLFLLLKFTNNCYRNKSFVWWSEFGLTGLFAYPPWLHTCMKVTEMFMLKVESDFLTLIADSQSNQASCHHKMIFFSMGPWLSLSLDKKR